MPGSVSGSSFGGSEGGASSASGSAVDVPLRVDGEFGDDRAFQTGLWGVLYTVSKEKGDIPYWFVFFRLFLDFLQLFLLTVNPAYGFHIPAKSLWWRVISFVQLNDFMSARGYAFFLVSLYVMVAGLVLAALLSVWVAYSFQNNQFSAVWPIQVLRWFANIFFQVLDVASMTLFLMALDCQYFGVPAAVKFRNQEFPDVYCWQMPHVIHAIVAIVSLIVFVVMASLFQMGDMELNPITRSPMAMAHSAVEVIAFFIKLVMTCASVFIGDQRWLSIIQLVLSLILLYLMVKWVPHYYPAVNYIRAGSYSAVAYAAVLFVVLAFHPGVHKADHKAWTHFSEAVTLALWAGLLPAAAFGASLAWARLYFMNKIVLRRFRKATPTTRPRELFVFKDAREVEILSRCCRVFVDADNNLDPKAVKLSEKVISVGLVQLPASPFMVILYSSYLMDVQSSYQTGYAQLQIAKKRNPSFLESFAIFIREQQHTQKSSSTAVNGGGIDLVTYVEFQRNYSLIIKVHKEALLAMRFFWVQLMHHKISFENLSRAINKFDVAVRNADRVYRMVMERHSGHVKIVRLYAMFLEHVKHDPWGAAKWFAEGEKLEMAEEEARQTNVFHDLQVDEEMREELLAAHKMGKQTAASKGPEADTGVIIVNAQGIVQMCNDAVVEMFGWEKKDLQHKNVNVLIPPPISEHHNNYIRQHVKTGREVIIGKITQVLALHRDRRVVPVMLKVVKVSGTGEDSLFLGLLEAIPPVPNTATLWVFNSGAVMSADGAFSDFCGYRSQEVAGVSLALLTASKTEDLTMIMGAARDAATSMEPSRLSLADSTTGLAAPDPTARPKEDFSMNPNAYAGTNLPQSGASVTDNNTKSNKTRRQSVLSLQGGGGVTYHRKSGPNINWDIPDILMNHKFSEPVLMDINISNAGIGAFAFHVIRMHRASSAAPPGAGPASRSTSNIIDFQRGVTFPDLFTPHQPLPPPDHMLVSDSKGRIVHCTGALATRLLSNPKIIMANNSPRALQHLIVEPFSSLHATWLAETDVLVPPAPRYSCRSGLSQLLVCRPPDNAGLFDGPPGGSNGLPMLVPFRLNITKRIVAATPYHITMLQEVSMQQAVAERRLILSVDEQGTIVGVSSDSPATLFGFEPEETVGKKIASVVDIFQAMDWRRDDDSGSLLHDLASRSMDDPGASWRVGVIMPLQYDPAAMSNASAQLMGKLMGSTATPAVMRVRVKPPKANAAAPTRTASSRQAAHLHGLVGLSGDGDGFFTPASPGQPGGAPADHHDDAYASNNAIMRLPDPRMPSTLRSQGSAANRTPRQQIEPSGLVFELEIWNAEILTGVLQVDNAGRIVPGNRGAEAELYDPGLVLGMSSQQLVGLDLAPLLEGRSVTDLMSASITDTSDAASLPTARKRSNLKSIASAAERSRVGPCHTVQAVHRDGYDIALNVQAVRGSTGFWIIIRPDKPLCGRANFTATPATRVSRAAALLPAAPQGAAPARTGKRPAPPGRRQSLVSMGGSTQAEKSLITPRPKSEEQGEEAAGNSAAKPTANEAWTENGTPPPPTPTLQGLPKPHAVAAAAAPGGAPERVVAKRATFSLAEPDSSTPQLLEPPRPSPSPQPNRMASMTDDVDLGALPAHDPKSESIKAWLLSGGAVFPFGEGEASGNANTAENIKPAASPGGSISVDDPDHEDHSVSPRTPRTFFTEQDAGGGQEGHNKGQVRTSVALLPDDPEYDNRSAGSDLDENGKPPPLARRSSQVSQEHAAQSMMKDINKDKPDSDHGSGAHQSQLSDAETPGVDDQDYRRGRRFKKLARMLCSPAVQHVLRTFKRNTIILVCVVLAVHVGVFVLMDTLLRHQGTNIFMLHQVGEAGKVAAEVAVHARSVQLIMTNQTAAGLEGLQNREDLPKMMQELQEFAEEFDHLHHGVMLGFNGRRRLPNDFGLRDLWEQPQVSETQFYPIPANESEGNTSISAILNSTTNLSMFRVGNRLIYRANEMVQNGLAYEASGGDLFNWPELMYIIENFESSVAPGYLQTMDAMVRYVILLADHVNLVQLVVLFLEGIALSMLVTGYVFYMARKVAMYRHTVYSVFLSVPQPLIRQLATRPMALTTADEEDEANDNVVALAGGEGAVTEGDGTGDGEPAKAKPDKPHTYTASAVKISVKRAASGVPETTAQQSEESINDSKVAKGFVDRLTACFRVFRANGNKVVPSGKKKKSGNRKLRSSNRTSVLLALVFALWGALVTIMNARGYMMLLSIASPIATFNIVNFVDVMYTRNFFYIQELVARPKSPAEVAELRVTLKQKIAELTTQYLVMAYGNQMAPEEEREDPHFASVDVGIAYSIPAGADLLFWTSDCLCLDQDACKEPEDPLYKVVMNGVNPMFVKFLETGNVVARMTSPQDPSIEGPEFRSYWRTRDDLTGGLSRISDVYQEHVINAYDHVIDLHIILLVMTVLLLVGFLLLILRPFMAKTSNESRRIAELLCQLPPEVDVEELLQHALTKMLNSSTASVVLGTVGHPTDHSAGLAASAKRAQSFKRVSSVRVD